jgi:hypothetical protein
VYPFSHEELRHGGVNPNGFFVVDDMQHQSGCFLNGHGAVVVAVKQMLINY